VGAAVYAVLVAAYYVVLGPYLGSTVAGTTLLALFTFSVRSSPPTTSLVPQRRLFFAFF
jgi:palmitoyltransferase